MSCQRSRSWSPARAPTRSWSRKARRPSSPPSTTRVPNSRNPALSLRPSLGGLVALVGGLVALVGGPVALVGGLVAPVGGLVAPVGVPVALVRGLVALVGEAISDVRLF